MIWLTSIILIFGQKATNGRYWCHCFPREQAPERLWRAVWETVSGKERLILITWSFLFVFSTWIFIEKQHHSIPCNIYLIKRNEIFTQNYNQVYYNKQKCNQWVCLFEKSRKIVCIQLQTRPTTYFIWNKPKGQRKKINTTMT